MKSLDFFDVSQHIAQIIAADAISMDFEPSQSFGKTLSAFPEVLLKSSPFDGFSNYSAEECHEFVHGKGTCPSYLARNDNCTGQIGQLAIESVPLIIFLPKQ